MRFCHKSPFDVSQGDIPGLIDPDEYQGLKRAFLFLCALR